MTAHRVADDARLAAAYSALVAARSPVRRDGCPPPDALLAVVTRDGPEPDRLRTINHALGCAACRPELELLRAVAVARTPMFAPRRPLVIGLAAAVVVAIGVGVALDRRALDVGRGGEATITIAPVGDVSTSPPFIWHAVPGATDYQVVVATASGTPVRDTTTRDTVLAARPLDAGREYYWLVRARLRDGTERVAAPVRFRVRP